MTASAWWVMAAPQAEGDLGGPSPVVIKAADDVVTLGAQARRSIGLHTVTLQERYYQPVAQAYGRVPSLQPLFDLQRRYRQARARLDGAEAQRTAAGAEYRRLRTLHREQHNASLKEVQAGRAAWVAAGAGVHTARADLEALATEARQRWGSSIAGWVKRGGAALARLRRGQDFLLQLTLPAGTTMDGASAEATVLPPGGGRLTARKVSASPGTDPRVQGQSYYYLARGGNAGLRYGMTVTGLLPRGAPLRGVIVPDASVVWSRGSAWIFLARGADRFVRWPLPTDRPAPGGGWFVESGLPAGTQIVISGAQILFSEQARAAAPKAPAGGEDMDTD
ncbi:MAG TPA: hypothetical protein VKA13_08200 [Gammaproteobacteria bacterium]|nr:hypothetical protein [Gammaproteobacteria bacterium]